AVGETQPTGDAAVTVLDAVVVDEASAPLPPQRRVVAARDQARVLHRDHRLIVIAVQRPRLHLALAALSAVQEAVERMQAVIAPGADVAQRRFQRLRAQKGHRQSVLTERSPSRLPPPRNPLLRRAGARPNLRSEWDSCC